MPFSPIEEIKNRLDIAEVVQDYVQLHKTGINLRGLCPFHTEKSPSFFVSPSRQSWHCFGGCGEGGDMFTFIMKVEGVEFGDALRLLAKKAGVELPERSPSLKRFETERQRLLDLLSWAARFYQRQLEASKRGEEARQYLCSRGMTEESIREWGIGYAPESPGTLLEFLTGKGFSPQEAEKAGAASRMSSGFADRFRGRIIFPVADLGGQVVGFGGRIFGPGARSDAPKYINSPATPVYDKSRVLYGLDKAKVEIRREDSCLLVEGYMDAIMARQAGTKHAVAASGTALTPQHLRVLKRYSSNLVTAFDMDRAGGAATRRSIDLAVSEGFSVRVAVMPEGKDPADVASERPDEWKKLVGEGMSVFNFYFHQARTRFDASTPEGKKAVGAFLLPVIKRIPNRIEQAHWVSQLASELGVQERVVEEELQKAGDGDPLRPAPLAPPASQSRKSRREMLEDRLTVLCFRMPELLEREGSWRDHVSEAGTRRLEIIAKHPDLVFPGAESPVSSEEKDRLHALMMLAEKEKDDEREDKEVIDEFGLCIEELRLLAVRKRLDEIALQIREAEARGEKDRVDQLLDQFSLVSREISGA